MQETNPEIPVENAPKKTRTPTPEMLENLKKAREKALTARQDLKALKERERLLEKEEIDARWDRIYEREQKIKEATNLQEKAKAKTEAKKPKKTNKSKIIHVSPPLSEVSSVVSSSSEEEYIPPATTSRREHRKNAAIQPRVGGPQPQPPKPLLQTQQQLHQPPNQLEQLHRAMRALGLPVK
jgi:DNA repair exonuclease SbcCD ATPase subunit